MEGGAGVGGCFYIECGGSGVRHASSQRGLALPAGAIQPQRMCPGTSYSDPLLCPRDSVFAGGHVVVHTSGLSGGWREIKCCRVMAFA